MRTSFALIDLPFALKPAGVGVIVSELVKAAFAWQVIDATVSDVAEIQSLGSEPAETQCRAHTIAFFVAAA